MGELLSMIGGKIIKFLSFLMNLIVAPKHQEIISTYITNFAEYNSVVQNRMQNNHYTSRAFLNDSEIIDHWKADDYNSETVSNLVYGFEQNIENHYDKFGKKSKILKSNSHFKTEMKNPGISHFKNRPYFSQMPEISSPQFNIIQKNLNEKTLEEQTVRIDILEENPPLSSSFLPSPFSSAVNNL